MSKYRLTTADQVIDHLGGTTKTARLLNTSAQAVHNWRERSKLPPRYFLVLSKELQSRGAAAPPSLWGILERVI